MGATSDSFPPFVTVRRRLPECERQKETGQEKERKLWVENPAKESEMTQKVMKWSGHFGISRWKAVIGRSFEIETANSN